jgi:hypothetical protein
MRKEIERLGHYHRPSRDKIGSLLRLGYPTRLPSAKGFRRKEFASSLPPLMTIQINNYVTFDVVNAGSGGITAPIKRSSIKP